MKELNQNTVGLIVGAFLGLVHALWAILVAIGVAQALMDWVLSEHFLNNPFSVSSFNFGKAVILVLMTFIGGYVSGWVFAALWNILIKKE